MILGSNGKNGRENSCCWNHSGETDFGNHFKFIRKFGQNKFSELIFFSFFSHLKQWKLWEILLFSYRSIACLAPMYTKRVKRFCVRRIHRLRMVIVMDVIHWMKVIMSISLILLKFQSPTVDQNRIRIGIVRFCFIYAHMDNTQRTLRIFMSLFRVFLLWAFHMSFIYNLNYNHTCYLLFIGN